MKKFALFIVSALLLFSCKPSVDLDAQFAQLKDNQTKFILTLDGKPFYEEDAIFKGHFEAKKNFFAMNVLNQYGGNFILMFEKPNWFNEKKIKGGGDASFSNLMVGKVIDAKNHKGAGYLMMKGEIEPITISKSKVIYRVSGISKKYPNVREEDPTFEIEGYILSKNPEFSEYSIKH